MQITFCKQTEFPQLMFAPTNTEQRNIHTRGQFIACVLHFTFSPPSLLDHYSPSLPPSPPPSPRCWSYSRTGRGLRGVLWTRDPSHYHPRAGRPLDSSPPPLAGWRPLPRAGGTCVCAGRLVSWDQPCRTCSVRAQLTDLEAVFGVGEV